MHSSMILCIAAIFACAYAQVFVRPGHEKEDLAWFKQIGNGKIFGTLGSTDQGLFGKAGYEQQIFNDHRGKFDAQAYGSRVLGSNGDSSQFGGRLDWSNKNAEAAVDVSKQIGGETSVLATGSGVWNIDKDTKVTAGGAINQEIGRGKPDVAVQAQFQHDF